MTTFLILLWSVCALFALLMLALGIATAAEFALYRATGKRYIDLVNGKSRPGCGNTQDGSEKSTYHQYTKSRGKCQ